MHTPTPWETLAGNDTLDIGPSNNHAVLMVHNDQGPDCETFDDGGKPSAQVSANAEFIVRACNAHDGLLGLIRDIVDEATASLPPTERLGRILTAIAECPSYCDAAKAEGNL